MALVWLYRKNGGQCLQQATDPSAFTGVDATYFATVTDPPAPDGVNLVPAKIWDGAQVRNASAAEIAGFPARESTDQNLADRADAKVSFTRGGPDGKVLRVILEALIGEINILRAAVVPPLPARTRAQVLAFIQSKIDGGNVD